MKGKLSALATLWLPQLAAASCGSAFCVVNTGSDAIGVWDRPGTRVDLRYEYIVQDQLRSGTSKVTPQGEPGEHDELKTRNQNMLLGIDHSFDGRWGLSVYVPYVRRDHTHQDNHLEEEVHEDGEVHTHVHSELESWDIRGIGDIRVVGVYQFAPETGTSGAWGLRAGLKLPTGRTDERNAEGVPAERTLQPGTGTTDAILGAYYRGPAFKSAEWYVSASAQAALDSHQGFKPGNQFGADLGLNLPLSGVLTGVVQLNMLVKGRDEGAVAEPEDSGGTYLFLSPGLSWAVSRNVALYAFAQVPLYQRVNGVQLSYNTGGTIGASIFF